MKLVIGVHCFENAKLRRESLYFLVSYENGRHILISFVNLGPLFPAHSNETVNLIFCLKITSVNFMTQMYF